jgi:very-short-patch-repair endonuclease
MANQQARRLRRRMTPQEVKLWVHLRRWKRLGYHFRRQMPHLGYVLDFACLTPRLVIELDGSQHGFDAHVRRDTERDRTLATAGFRVLRFWNFEVDRDLDGVLRTIWGTLEEAGPPTHRPSGGPPSPLRGEG